VKVDRVRRNPRLAVQEVEEPDACDRHPRAAFELREVAAARIAAGFEERDDKSRNP
jgi:hypothetical protein